MQKQQKAAPRRERGDFGVVVDQKKCRTVGVCVRELPQVFQFQAGSKKASVAASCIPVELRTRCVEVAALCPVEAIRIGYRRSRHGGEADGGDRGKGEGLDAKR